MKRVNGIRKHPVYEKELKAIHKWEEDRIYCKHGLDHQLEVARLAYIISLEEGLMLDKELIYAAALLHDIGRAMEYEKGIPHEIASVDIAKKILNNSDFSEEEKMMIIEAVGTHRDTVFCKIFQSEEECQFGTEQLERLKQVLFLADKRCRNCFACEAADTCKWKEEKKNKEIFL